MMVATAAVLWSTRVSYCQGAEGWRDWRGPSRAAHSPDVPLTLPKELKLIWERPLTGAGLAGLAVAEGRVVLADKTAGAMSDAWRCLDAETGKELWSLTYPAPKQMDYDNAPRAAPVIHNGFVYLLGAFGHLHGVELATGKVIWRKEFPKDFGSEVPEWGFCSSPLVVDDKLIVNPGSTKASLVALDLRTGAVVWQTPGEGPAYAAFILGEFGGRRQFVGYDSKSVGGWDPATGKRLWRLAPPEEGDYNVATPVAVDGQLFLATEMNGARLYDFDSKGRILPGPVAVNEDMAPDMCSPIAVDGLILGGCGYLMCLDLNRELATAWESFDERYGEYCSLIAGNSRVLVTSIDGWLSLLEATGSEYRCVSRLDLYPGLSEKKRITWSHPALVGSRYYIRNQVAAYCFEISNRQEGAQ